MENLYSSNSLEKPEQPNEERFVGYALL